MDGKKGVLGKLKPHFWDKNEKRVYWKLHNHSTCQAKNERGKHWVGHIRCLHKRMAE